MRRFVCGLTVNEHILCINLSGPQEILFFEGDPIEEVMFWIPDRNPLATAVSILSYNGNIRVGLAVDEAVLEGDTEVRLLCYGI